jgi:hypothetical protein
MTLLLDTLYFSPTDPIKHRAIKVSLFGQSLVWLRADANTSTSSTNYEYWRDKAPLFEIAANVLPFFHSNASTLQPGDTYSYPFQFCVPASTGNSRVGQHEEDADKRWTVPSHLLLHTFLHTGRYDTNSGDDVDYAKVEYGIVVRLVCPGVGVAKGPNLHDQRVTAPVLFAPRDTSLKCDQIF